MTPGISSSHIPGVFRLFCFSPECSVLERSVLWAGGRQRGVSRDYGSVFERREEGCVQRIWICLYKEEGREVCLILGQWNDPLIAQQHWQCEYHRVSLSGRGQQGVYQPGTSSLQPAWQKLQRSGQFTDSIGDCYTFHCVIGTAGEMDGVCLYLSVISISQKKQPLASPAHTYNGCQHSTGERCAIKLHEKYSLFLKKNKLNVITNICGCCSFF